ncbi:S8 family serine peptidase [Paenibacillaceae bacterium WGS1546]|uniref:S8 family serine peptidase n=1 Tax=Cohnella sp. WGS1546 TaxID=3366810 RepID=UPI00372D6CC3
MQNNSIADVPRRRDFGRSKLASFIALLAVAAMLSAHAVLPEGSFAGPKHPEVELSVIDRTPENNTNRAGLIAPPLPDFVHALGIPAAWAALKEDVTSTIAIVDTGVDFRHPELAPYLLNGINLVNERKTAQDDNGHGTAVAGVIVSVAKAGELSRNTGRWRGKLLPIKALDQFGAGNEEKLTQGIRYAVDQGADIVVLSLGLRRDAPGLREAVAYAESRGALLVAASGNDAAVFGDKAAIQYPAAYPTVLAVSGMAGTRPVGQATSGPENDLSAVWSVQTAALGGKTIETEGTSMGAPQAAAVAAMLKAAHPDWQPLQLREALRRSAAANGSASWNQATGYGMLSAAQALRTDHRVDWREPNNARSSASAFPLGKEVAGAWSRDADWYYFDAPYDGLFRVGGDSARLTLYGYDGVVKPQSAASTPSGWLMQWPVKKGRNWLVAQKPNHPQAPGSYRFFSGFAMHPDAHEPNDSAASAGTLPPRTQTWTGTFHRRGDVDWMTVTLPKPGILKLTVEPDTTRIDPELRIIPAGGKEIVVDERGDGGIEYWTLNNAKAGKYYFRISNAVSSNPEAVIGTYVATMEYITDKEDPYEPNDNALASTPLASGKLYQGLFHAARDEDWFRFTVGSRQTVKLTVGQIPASMKLKVELRDKKLQTLDEWSSGGTRRTLVAEKPLPPGTYYLKLTADRADRSQYYGLRLQFKE